MRIGVDHLAASELVDGEEVKRKCHCLRKPCTGKTRCCTGHRVPGYGPCARLLKRPRHGVASSGPPGRGWAHPQYAVGFQSVQDQRATGPEERIITCLLPRPCFPYPLLIGNRNVVALLIRCAYSCGCFPRQCSHDLGPPSVQEGGAYAHDPRLSCCPRVFR